MTISIGKYLGNGFGLLQVLWTAGYLALFTAALSGCAATKDNSNEGESDAKENTGNDVGAGDTDYVSADSSCEPNGGSLADEDAEALFDYDHVPTFDIFLPKEAWESLQKNARDEEYTEAEACFEGKRIGTVGLRFKGSYGSLFSCFNDDGENTCRKLGMKVKFNEYDEEKRFYGLKRLNFQGYRYDDSYIKEKLAYDLYRSVDIVVPRATWANVRVNGKLQGLFGMVEQIDGRFTADRWPENPDQNLYKEAWPVKDDDQWVISHLKTNKETPDVGAFIDFSEAILAADEDKLRDTLDQFVDLNYFARYMAVDDAVANFDGVTAYYTSDDALWAGNHNFYFYQEATDHFSIIPWDLESTFSVGTFGAVPHWTTVPDDCNAAYPAWGDWNTPVIAPGCDRVFRALAADVTVYRETGHALLDGPFTEEAMCDRIDEHAAFILDSVQADPNGRGMTAFKNGLSAIKTQLPVLRARLKAIMAGETWTPLQIDADGVTDFEQQDDLGLVIGTELYAGPDTKVSFSVNADTPMAGEQDLMLSFEFANGGEEWDQWITYIVPLKMGNHDVRDLSGIRLRIRADQKRPLRLELDNTYVSSVNNWLREGWDISVSEETAQVKVLFEDAAIPGWAVDQGLEPVATLDEVLSSVRGLLFSPQCIGRDATGFLPDNTTDEGFVEIDEIEFF